MLKGDWQLAFHHRGLDSVPGQSMCNL